MHQKKNKKIPNQTRNELHNKCPQFNFIVKMLGYGWCISLVEAEK